jgi:hypothetical protein
MTDYRCEAHVGAEAPGRCVCCEAVEAADQRARADRLAAALEQAAADFVTVHYHVAETLKPDVSWCLKTLMDAFERADAALAAPAGGEGAERG